MNRLTAVSSSRVLLPLAVGVVFAAPSLAHAAITTYVVDDAADIGDLSPGDGVCADYRGYCTLRAAVDEANANPGMDRIQLDSVTYALTLGSANENANTGGDLDVTDSVIFEGVPGTVIQSEIDRLVHVFELTPWPLEVYFDNIEFRDGDATLGSVGGTGGAIRSSSTWMEIVNCTFEDNVGVWGGAVNYEGHDLYVTGSQFQWNQAERGGALASTAGVVRLHDTDMSDNEATVTSGGAVYLSSTGYLSLSNTSFDSNMAARHGGAVYVYPDESASSSPEGVISGASFENNEAQWDGGGLTVSRGMELEVGHTEFAGNTAGNMGGGIWSMSGMVIEHSTLAENSAGSGGGIAWYGKPGTLLELENSTLSGNTADSRGGGLFVFNGDVEMSSSTVAFNSAINGGGIYYNGSSATFTMRGSLVGGNWAHHPSYGGDCSTPVNPILSDGYNLITNASMCGFIDLSSDLAGGLYVSYIPGLLPLANNGGLTRTHALGIGGAARDGGATVCKDAWGASLLVDQRGTPRPNGPACDIGAFEE